MKFSLVIPVYNVSKFLQQGLESAFVAVKAVGDSEMICVDDGSTDGSSEMIDAFERTMREKGVDIVVVHQSNAGVGAARNSGLARARGNWVSFMDPDDMVSETYYLDMLTAMGDDDTIDIVGSSVVKVDMDGTPFATEDQWIMPSEKIFFDDVLLQIWGTPYLRYVNCVWDKIFRREMIVKYGILFVQGVHPGEDEGFAAEALAACRKFKVILPTSHYLYRQHPAQVMQHITVERRLRMEIVLERLIKADPRLQTKGMHLFVQQMIRWQIGAGGNYQGEDAAQYISRLTQSPRLKKLFLPYLMKYGCPAPRIFAVALYALPQRILFNVLLRRATCT